MTIANERDFRCGYEILQFLNERMGEVGDATGRRAEHIADLKRSLRAFAHRPVSESRIVSDEGIDGYVALIVLPECVRSFEAAEEYFAENLKRHYRPSMYDCTGQAFTNWHKVFVRRGRFWVYHSVSFDL